MAYLQADDAEWLKESFGQLAQPVTLKVTTRQQSRILSLDAAAAKPPGEEDVDLAAELRGLIDEVAATSPQITVEKEEAAEGDLPRIVFSSAKTKGTLRYFGMPVGYEMSTMIATVLDIGVAGDVMPPEIAERLAALTEPVHIRVFVTPSCPHCPTMARVAYQIAMVAPKVTADVVEVQEFPELGQKYDVKGVPLTVVNETENLLGAVNPMQLVELVEKLGAKAPSLIIT